MNLLTTVSFRVRAAAMIGLTALGLGLGGCNANQGSVDASRSLMDQNQRLLQENESLKASLDGVSGQIEQRDRTIAEQNSLISQLRQQLASAAEQLRSLQSRIAGLSAGPLPPELDQALQELARQYPDLVSYDSARGMLQLKSDVTFASGQDVVSDGAKASLIALSKILTSPVASGYDIRVVGHTDSQRISSGTAQRHPTNRHLSVHRAISVARELESMGVGAERIETSGWGEFLPAVPNTGSGNTPQNRRVELFLVRSIRSASFAPIKTGAQPAAAGEEQLADDIMK